MTLQDVHYNLLRAAWRHPIEIWLVHHLQLSALAALADLLHAEMLIEGAEYVYITPSGEEALYAPQKD